MTGPQGPKGASTATWGGLVKMTSGSPATCSLLWQWGPSALTVAASGSDCELSGNLPGDLVPTITPISTPEAEIEYEACCNPGLFDVALPALGAGETEYFHYIVSGPPSWQRSGAALA